MAQRLFSLNRIPVFLDNYTPGTERRRGETVKIITLNLRVQPFDSKMAHAVDDGLNNESGVKDAFFKASNGEPKKHRTRVNFDLGCTQQNLITYASTDTPTSRMAFAQCRIGGFYVRTQKDVNAMAACFRASFGPVSRDEMEFIHAWMGSQLAVTFNESEEQLDYEEPETKDEGDEEGDDEAPSGPKAPSEPPMFDDDDPNGLVETTGLSSDEADAKTKAHRERGHRYPPKGKKAAKRGKGKK
jgi:hypothetical protein